MIVSFSLTVLLREFPGDSGSRGVGHGVVVELTGEISDVSVELNKLCIASRSLAQTVDDLVLADSVVTRDVNKEDQALTVHMWGAVGKRLQCARLHLREQESRHVSKRRHSPLLVDVISVAGRSYD